jgi:hypothetical protein
MSTRIFVTNLLQTGLTGTLGFLILDSTGNTLVGHTVLGIAEEGTSAIYSVSVTPWDDSWSGVIKWDANGIILAVEDFTADLDTEIQTELQLVTAEIQGQIQTYDIVLISGSYVTLAGAQTYFDTRLNTQAWDLATPTDQTKALITASRSIDNLAFLGTKVVWSQANEFPRYITYWDRQLPANLVNIPNNIKIACCEIALTLLDGLDLEFEIPGLRVSDDKYSTLRTGYSALVNNDHTRAGIASAIAWTYLLPYLADPYAIQLVRC